MHGVEICSLCYEIANLTLVMMKPPMARNGVNPSSTSVSLQSRTKPMTNPPTNVASHCSSKATLSPIPAWILPTSLCVCGVCVWWGELLEQSQIPDMSIGTF